MGYNKVVESSQDQGKIRRTIQARAKALVKCIKATTILNPKVLSIEWSGGTTTTTSVVEQVSSDLLRALLGELDLIHRGWHAVVGLRGGVGRGRRDRGGEARGSTRRWRHGLLVVLALSACVWAR